MFNEAGQFVHCVMYRGGGKGGGGGGDNSWQYQTTTLVDPVTGLAYSSTPMDTAFGGKSASQQLNEAIQARQTKEQSDAATAKQQADADAAAKESTFQTNRQGAYDQAMQDAINAFKGQGVDPNAYMSQYITPALQRQYKGIQDLDPNPMASFPAGGSQAIVNQAIADKRQQATNQLNQIFNPSYATTQLSDTMVDPIVSQILGEQFDPLGQQLINAQKRGTLTDAGYKAALDALTQKRSAAESTVRSAAQGVLGQERSGLSDLISGARSDVSNLGLADAFDPSSYTGRASSLVGQDVSGFGGAVRNAVGNAQFADIQDLINAGGAVQGANRPTPSNPNVATGDGGPAAPTADDILQQQKRGLGSTGAF